MSRLSPDLELMELAVHNNPGLAGNAEGKGKKKKKGGG